MHETTAIVLLVVVLGQVLIFTVAGLAMWVAGEFGDPPRWWRFGRARDMGTANGRAARSGAQAGLLSLQQRRTDNRRRTSEDRRRIGGFPIAGSPRR